MKNKLDAARLKLSTVTPETPRREVERIISQLARECSGDELANLLSAALDDKQQAKKELDYCQVRLSVLVRARTTQQVTQRAHH